MNRLCRGHGGDSWFRLLWPRTVVRFASPRRGGLRIPTIQPWPLLRCAALPSWGEGRTINGVEMVEASFLWRDDHRHGATPSVLIHLNTLTDNHRAHIAPALAARVPGTCWWRFTSCCRRMHS